MSHDRTELLRRFGLAPEPSVGSIDAAEARLLAQPDLTPEQKRQIAIEAEQLREVARETTQHFRPIQGEFRAPFGKDEPDDDRHIGR